VLVVSPIVFAGFVVATICVLCCAYCYCRATEAKRKIVYMMEEAQLDVDADDLVNDESDDDDYEDEDDDETLATGLQSGASKSIA
jgi:hypothetical protein